MRHISALLLACALAAACAPRAALAQKPTPEGGVVVLNFEWHPQHRNERPNDHGLEGRGDFALNDPANPRNQRSVYDTTPNPDRERLSMPSSIVRHPMRVFYGYESSVHLKNEGTKTIKAVEWEHVFFKDKGGREELRRFRFRKGATVEPGAQKFVASRVRVQSYSPLPSRARQGVVIKRIEYADGSIWESQ